MGNLQKYESFTPETASAMLDDMEGDNEYLKLREGVTVLRFLPAPAGQKVMQKVFTHYVNLPGMERGTSFACPRLNGARRPCPVCAKVAELKESGHRADTDLAGQLEARARIFTNVIDRQHPERGPKVFAFGKQIGERLAQIGTNPRTGGDWADPGPRGFDVVITRKGMGRFDTEYVVEADRDRTPLSANDGEAEAWLQGMQDLKRFAKVPTDDELAKLLPGLGPSPNALSVGASRPAAPARQPARRTAADDLDDGAIEAKGDG